MTDIRVGVVTTFGSKGFGFLTDSVSGRSLFFHVADVEGRRELRAGDRVEFQEAQYARGPRAIQVNPLSAVRP